METAELDSRATALLRQAKNIAKDQDRDTDELLAEWHANFVERDQNTADELAVSERTLETQSVRGSSRGRRG